jgi:glycerol-3-phosphate dehydrogenase (NAD(P)+)
MRVSVLGAGAWGTAVAHRLAESMSFGETPSLEVVLYGRDQALINQLNIEKKSPHYLPNTTLSSNLQFCSDLQEALTGDFWITATPLSVLPQWIDLAKKYQAPLVNLSKGLNALTGQLPHEMATSSWHDTPHRQDRFSSLFGPSFAHEVANGQPCALVLACQQEEIYQPLWQHLSASGIRTYWSRDMIGVELGGALKNVMAIAAGISDGLSLGQNARAALLTRGLAEIARLTEVLGGKPETIMGLAGVGDLVLTATGGASRNRTVGLRLAKGETLESITTSLGHVAEGVLCTEAVYRRAKDLKVSMPIVESVYAILQKGLSPAAAVNDLLHREIKREF